MILADHVLAGLKAKLEPRNPVNAEYPVTADCAAMTEPLAGAQIAKWGDDFDAQVGPPRTEESKDRLKADVLEAQRMFAAQQTRRPERAMHTKGVLASHGSLEISANLPEALRSGPFQPGARLQGLVRYSNGVGRDGPDGAADRRGMAFVMRDAEGREQEFLLVSGTEEFIGRDGASAVAGLKAEAYKFNAPGARGSLAAAKSLVRDLVHEHGLSGVPEAVRMLRAQRASSDENKSLAANTYYSRVPFQWGEHAVKLMAAPRDTDTAVRGQGDDSLREDLRARLREGPVTYALQVKGYTDPKATPMNDARKSWSGDYVTVGRLTLPRQDPSDEQLARVLEAAEQHAFSPWHRWDESNPGAMRPLGDVNNVRREVYAASAEARAANPHGTDPQTCPVGY